MDNREVLVGVSLLTSVILACAGEATTSPGPSASGTMTSGPDGTAPIDPFAPTPTTPMAPVVTTGVAGAGAMPTDPAAMPGPLPPDAIATGISTTPIAYTDPDIQCHEFLAHPPGDLTLPLLVGIANDAYREVEFDVPWTGTVYAKSFRALIDNARVIHHWLFYLGGAADGGRSLQAGWAPGGSNMYLSDDLGMELPAQRYSIQYHYNSNDPQAVDASGVEVCVTPNRPANVATVSWLGTDAIFGTSARGICDPVPNERIHILAATPHMHRKGVRFNVTINRAAGGTDVVHDAPFDFADQHQYLHDVWLDPGDTITTTCAYNAPATFGPGTDDEMCYWFPVHYPANGLVDAGPFGKAIHGPNSCLGM